MSGVTNKGETIMKTTTLVLGTIAGVFGILGSLLVLIGGGAVNAVGGGSSLTITALIAIGASIVGIVGACLADDRPGLGASAMIGAAVVGFILVHWFYVVAAPLFLVGGLLVFMGRNEEQAAAATTAYSPRT